MYKNNLNFLTSYFTRSEVSNNYKDYEILNSSYDRIYKTIDKMKDIIDIDKAEGVHLDRIGQRVGQLRNTADDSIYRLYIKTKIIANKSKGDIPTMKEVAKVLFGNKFIGLAETWNNKVYGDDIAGIVIFLKPDFDSLPYMMNLVKAGGVKLYYQTVLPDEEIIIQEELFNYGARFPLSGKTKAKDKLVHSSGEEVNLLERYIGVKVNYNMAGRLRTKTSEANIQKENLSLMEEGFNVRVKYPLSGRSISGGGII